MGRLPRLIGVFGAVLACSAPALAQGKVNVIATTEDLASIARDVGGDRITVESIARGYQDPHFVEAKPSFILKLQKADLLIAVGRELEIGWLPPLVQQSRNNKIQPGGSGYLDASLGALILEIPTGEVTRAMGDVHPLGNPHYWLDPENGSLRRRACCDLLDDYHVRRETSMGAAPRSRGSSKPSSGRDMIGDVSAQSRLPRCG
jgi:zinc/manganese transport system substrate-binding protein